MSSKPQITKQGAQIKAQQQVEKREKLTRKKRWEQQDEDEAYAAKQLDRNIVNPDQIRTVIRTFRDKLPEIFPGRTEVPKTLIFAKTDSHADDIIQTVREEFGEGNAFCKKLTYKIEEDPKSVLAQFRNDYYPRIAVTVDMIATGTDVKPLECLLFMRDVKSRNYFEQMKGRGTRTLDLDDLKKVTPSADSAKTHYVIVDAIGVTKSLKTASQPLITKPSVPLKDLAMGVMMGATRRRHRELAGRAAGAAQQATRRRRPAPHPRSRRRHGTHATRRANCSARSTPTTSKPRRWNWPGSPSAPTPAMPSAQQAQAATGGRSRQRVERRTGRTDRQHPPRQGTDHRPRQPRCRAARRMGQGRRQQRAGADRRIRRIPESQPRPDRSAHHLLQTSRTAGANSPTP